MVRFRTDYHQGRSKQRPYDENEIYMVFRINGLRGGVVF